MSTLPAKMPKTTTLVQKGKEFVKFYKTGVFNVWGNYKLSRQLLKRYNASNSRQLISSIAQVKHLQDIKGEKASLENFTRQDLLVLARTPPDAAKLPLFGILLAVFFEFTPLLLILFPRLSPSTCFSPSFEKKRDNTYLKLREDLNQLTSYNEATSVYEIPRQDLLKFCAVLPGTPLFYRCYFTSALRKRLVAHLTFLKADNKMIRTEGEMASTELYASARARGLDISQPEDQLRQDLHKWMENFKDPADAGYLIAANQ